MMSPTVFQEALQDDARQDWVDPVYAKPTPRASCSCQENSQGLLRGHDYRGGSLLLGLLQVGCQGEVCKLQSELTKSDDEKCASIGRLLNSNIGKSDAIPIEGCKKLEDRQILLKLLKIKLEQVQDNQEEVFIVAKLILRAIYGGGKYTDKSVANSIAGVLNKISGGKFCMFFVAKAVAEMDEMDDDRRLTDNEESEIDLESLEKAAKDALAVAKGSVKDCKDFAKTIVDGGKKFFFSKRTVQTAGRAVLASFTALQSKKPGTGLVWAEMVVIFGFKVAKLFKKGTCACDQIRAALKGEDAEKKKVLDECLTKVQTIRACAASNAVNFAAGFTDKVFGAFAEVGAVFVCSAAAAAATTVGGTFIAGAICSTAADFLKVGIALLYENSMLQNLVQTSTLFVFTHSQAFREFFPQTNPNNIIQKRMSKSKTAYNCVGVLSRGRKGCFDRQEHNALSWCTKVLKETLPNLGEAEIDHWIGDPEDAIPDMIPPLQKLLKQLKKKLRDNYPEPTKGTFMECKLPVMASQGCDCTEEEGEKETGTGQTDVSTAKQASEKELSRIEEEREKLEKEQEIRNENQEQCVARTQRSFAEGIMCSDGESYNDCMTSNWIKRQLKKAHDVQFPIKCKQKIERRRKEEEREERALKYLEEQKKIFMEEFLQEADEAMKKQCTPESLKAEYKYASFIRKATAICEEWEESRQRQRAQTRM